MRMGQIIIRAFKDTLSQQGISALSVPRLFLYWFAGSVAVVVVMGLYRGWTAAMTEAEDILIYVLAGGGVVFAFTFLWNLWLAPYKILNERLDEIASTHPPKEVDEEAARRSRNHVMNHNTQSDMRRLKYCIEERENRRHGHPYYSQGDQDFDHDFMTLKAKYSSWLPTDLKERKIMDWAGRIIAIFKAHDYEDAVKRVERAVAEKSWVEGAPNDG